MELTPLHSSCLAGAFRKALATGQADGTVAFARFFEPWVTRALAGDKEGFALDGWDIWRVADRDDRKNRTTTAEQALAVREGKAGKTLLLVDTSKAGPPMGEIAESSREIREEEILPAAERDAMARIKDPYRAEYARQAARAARLASAHIKNSRWTVFDYVCRVAASDDYPGELIGLLGLWPAVKLPGLQKPRTEIDLAYRFVDVLLCAKASVPPETRIEELQLDPTPDQRRELVDFLRKASAKTRLDALLELSGLCTDKPMRHLWVNALRLSDRIRLVPWREIDGSPARWSGLTEGPTREDPLELHVPRLNGKPNALTVRWRGLPTPGLGRVSYEVRILSGGEVVASEQVPHRKKQPQEIKFSRRHIGIDSDTRTLAHVRVFLVQNPENSSEPSEEFLIIIPKKGGNGNGPGRGRTVRVRTFSEAVVSANSPSEETPGFGEGKCHVLMRIGKTTFEVYRPPLVKEIESDWFARDREIGRWIVKVKSTGERIGSPEFVPVDVDLGSSIGARVWGADRDLAERLRRCRGGVGHIHYEEGGPSAVSEYVDAWTELYRWMGKPEFALAHTVEIQTASGTPVGLVVLPSHPLRMAWHAAYDSLVLDTYLREGEHDADIFVGLQDMVFGTPIGPLQKKKLGKRIIDEFSAFDGSMFPTFLPAMVQEKVFVHGGMHGFHTSCMVLADDPEPKATLAVLDRALAGECELDMFLEGEDRSAEVLGKQIVHYMDLHKASDILRVHAIRAGDGKTVARALGFVQRSHRDPNADEDAPGPDREPFFVLDLYPAPGNLGISGRHIAVSLERQRLGSGGVDIRDRWMREAAHLPQGTVCPRLRWARKDPSLDSPKVSAHVALAFNMFESSVVPGSPGMWKSRPPHVFGLLNFFDSRYLAGPSPTWHRTIPHLGEGQEHPADPSLIRRLDDILQAVHALVTGGIGPGDQPPALVSEITTDRVGALERMHGTCDWVLTLQQHGGVEYFDSPNELREIYEKYVISSIPEHRVDTGLQLVTSTSNVREVDSLLEETLDDIGVESTGENTDFILKHLKAYSGKSAIDLTGQVVPVPRTIALALCYASCLRAPDSDLCWLPLRDGFFVPYEDVRELLGVRDETPDQDEPDVVHVSVTLDGGLAFRFAGIAYCGSASEARSPYTYRDKQQGIEKAQRDWRAHYDAWGICRAFKAVRLARLARLLRFHVDRAARHHLSDACHSKISEAIDRMVKTNESYPEIIPHEGGRVWVLSPQHKEDKPELLSVESRVPRAFLFGVGLLPDQGMPTARDNL